MKEMSTVVKTITKFAFAPIFLFGAYIIAHGHLTPGGGFQGGAIIATLMALVLVAFGKTEWRRKTLSVIESSGLLAFIGLAFLGLTSGFFFFNFLAGNGDTPIFSEAIDGGVGASSAPFFSSGTIALMNISVGIEVVAALTLIVVALAAFCFDGKEGE